MWWKIYGEQQPPIQWTEMPSNADNYKWGKREELEMCIKQGGFELPAQLPSVN